MWRYIQWNIIQSQRRKFCLLQQHEWTSKALCYVKKVKERKTCIVRSHFHAESKKSNLQGRKVVVRSWGGDGITADGDEAFF